MNAFQSNLIRYLQSRSAAPDASLRWPVYHESYVSRPVVALSDSILERVAKLLGQSFLRQRIAEYLCEVPPQHPIMVECLRGFHPWLARQGWDETHPELSALVELSLMRWDVLVGPDPETLEASTAQTEADLHFYFFQKNHKLMVSNLPIYDLWMAGDPEGVIEQDQWIADQPQAVLFYKSSATTLETLLIHPDLVPLIQALSSGAPLIEAIQNFMESSVTDTAFDALPALIAHLQATGALKKNCNFPLTSDKG